MPHVHLGWRNGFTKCRIFIPNMPEDDRYWIPGPGEKEPGPVTCPHCLTGGVAPLSTAEPRALRMVIVYENPLDFPGEFVARERFIDGSGQKVGEIVGRGKTLLECRAPFLRDNPGLYRIPRHQDDDPVIVESWV